MLADLRAPASSAGLVAGGYALFFGGLLMLGARLGDRFGHRRTIIASLAVLAGGHCWARRDHAPGVGTCRRTRTARFQPEPASGLAVGFAALVGRR
jgi:MFS family permease